MKRATGVILGLIAVTIVLARPANAQVKGGASSNGVALKKSAFAPVWGKPNPDWKVWWHEGPDVADNLIMPMPIFEHEDKLEFDGAGNWGPGGRVFTGFHKVWGPGSFMSISITSGYGFSSSRYVNRPGDPEGPRDFVPVVDLTVTADGLLGPPGVFKKPYWESYAEGNDPIILRYSDMSDVPPGETVDLMFSVEIHEVHWGTSGRVHYHLWYETAAGSVELGDISLDHSGVAVTAGDPTASYVLRDSLGQGPPAPGDPRLDANQFKAALAAHIAGAGDSLIAPVPFYVVLPGVTLPTVPLPPGPVAGARATSTARAHSSAGTASTALADDDDMAAYHIDVTAQAELGAGSRMIEPFSNVAVPPDPISYVVVPDRAPIIDIGFPPMSPPSPGADDDVALYELLPSGWMLRTIWNWNAGTVRSFIPDAGVQVYALAGCANQYGIPFNVSYPLTTHAPTPPTPATMPDFALGTLDYTQNPFNPVLGQGQFGTAPPINVLPGMQTQFVPQYIGANHWEYQPLQYNFQVDPTRPWLYVGNNPAQGLAQPTFLTIHFDGLFDPFGSPIQNLPIDVYVYQGPAQYHFPSSAHYDPNGKVVFQPINIGTLLPQPFTIIIGVPGGLPPVPQGQVQQLTASRFGAQSVQDVPGFFSMNGVVVSNGATIVTGVDPITPTAGPIALTFEPVSPNPCRDQAQLAFSTARDERVRVAIYDLNGREVRTLLDESLSAGPHRVTWDGMSESRERVDPGVYFVRVREGAEVAMRKITMIR